MAEQKKGPQESKRKTLKTILGSAGAVAGASALPEKWSKPLISSVVLPAHATTSECVPLDFSIQDVEGNPPNAIIEMVASDEIAFEVPAQVEIFYNSNEAQGNNFETDSELAFLLGDGTFNVGSPNEVEVTETEVQFDYCGEAWNLEEEIAQ